MTTKTSVLRTLGSVTAWALLHSLTATRASKDVAIRLLGKRAEEGLYRLAYNGIAVASTAALLLYLHRLPDRTLYRVRGPARVSLSAVRLALLLVALRGAVEIGIGPFSGVSEALAWLQGQRTFPPPEAQGPATDPHPAGKRLKTGGPFRYVRHPLNASASAIFLLTPNMTAVRLTLALMMLVYALIGSKLEERRLLEMYGERYARYAAETPFFLPLGGVWKWLRVGAEPTTLSREAPTDRQFAEKAHNAAFACSTLSRASSAVAPTALR